MRKWLQLFRAQTGFATFYSVTVPYLLAGGDPRLIPVLLPLSLALHYASFGHNSVMDYWYDVKDVHKKHHPLVSGEISLRRGHQVIHTLMCLVALTFTALTLLVSPKPSYALASLLLCTVFGHAYNDGLDKNTIHSWAPISLCFASMAAYGWFLAGGEVNKVFVLLLAVVFSSIFYQIAFEGNLKDICVEHTLLNEVGKAIECRTERGETRITYEGPTFWWLRVLFDTLAIEAMIMLTSGSWLALLTLTATTVTQLYFIVKLEKVKYGLPRDEMLELFGRIEAIQFFRIMSVIVVDLQSLVLYLALVLAGATYFVLMNAVLWGSRWGPKV